MHNTDFTKSDLLSLFKKTNIFFAHLSEASALIYTLQLVNDPDFNKLWVHYSDFLVSFYSHINEIINKIESLPD